MWITRKLKSIWGLEIEVPLVHKLPWHVASPSRMQTLFSMVKHPVPVSEFRENPIGKATPAEQLRMIGSCLLDILARRKPHLHRSLIGKNLVVTTGTTILVTMMDKLNTQVIPLPWNAGEPWKRVMQRMVAARKMENHPLTQLLYTSMVHSFHTPRLPSPQAVLSVVGHYGFDWPTSSIMGSGGSCPWVIVAGRKGIHFTWDHRVYSAHEAMGLYDDLMSRLEKARGINVSF
jgi:hypothetical protein